MKHISAIAFFALLPALSAAEELPLKRVVLSTSGLAQFTYSGEVSASTVIGLPVRLDQVDDILKSLTIFDSAGAIGAVSLAGKTPLDELFRDLPFDRQALESQTALLNALTGAEVEIEGDVNAKGRVFRIETEQVQLPDHAGQTERHRLTLITDGGFVQAILENVKALRFADPQLRAQIDRAISGVALNRAKDQRIISIALSGQAARRAGFSYVVNAPVWKTAYRLILPKDGGKARLQGWGILENLTGGDWRDVELTLVSGNPVALKQPLYSAVYVDRPEIPVAASARIVPRKDDAEAQDRDAAAEATPHSRSLTRSLNAMPISPAPAPAGSIAARIAEYGGLAAKSIRQTEEMGLAALKADAEEEATQVLYRFRASVTLASGATMMIPFVDREVPASRIYLFQPETNAHRPLAAVRLRNDGDSALPAGLVTAFDTGGDGAVNFAGDAQLPLLSRGGTRFVTFALDSKTDIRRSDRGVKQTRLGKIIRGQLSVTVKSLWAIDYEITPPAEEDREVVIEEPRMDNWQLSGGAKDIEETPTRLRYTVMAAKGKTTKATLSREHTDYETVILTSGGADRLLATFSGLQNQTPALTEAIGKLSALAGEISKTNSRRRDLEGERRKITDGQDRIRKNLASAGQSSDLGRRYLEALKADEDRLAAIAAEDVALERDIAAKTKAAEDVAQSLVL